MLEDNTPRCECSNALMPEDVERGDGLCEYCADDEAAEAAEEGLQHEWQVSRIARVTTCEHCGLMPQSRAERLSVCPHKRAAWLAEHVTISGTIEVDGVTTSFTLGSVAGDFTWQQWGGVPKEHLSRVVPLLDAMQEGIQEADPFNDMAEHWEDG